MADKNKKKSKMALRRRRRVRNKIKGTAERPRLTVCKTLNNIFAQIIDDDSHTTMVAMASNSKALAGDIKKSMKKTEVAGMVGMKIAEAAGEKGIKIVVFDRNRNRFHGRVRAVAEAARKAGLKF